MSGMATTKAPYDPVKALEGMFNGSVTRIAYVIKDPINYSASTKMVLTECAKRFHDALDDCEIQLLDAKWYLEHQLTLNKARREAKEREIGTAAAKRKHDAIKDIEEPQHSENAPKRTKIDGMEELRTEQGTSAPTETPKASPAPAKPATQVLPEKEQPESQSQDQIQAAISTSQQDKPSEPSQDEIQPLQDDFAKPTPQATPAGTNDDFNFESMFGDPGGDPQDNKDDDLNFDFAMGDALDTNIGGANNNPSSLDSLLPGLDSFANQPSDSLNNIPDAGQEDVPSYSNFDLPEIGGTNVFDDFLNDDSLGRGNYEDNVDLSEEALNITDFDDSFLM